MPRKIDIELTSARPDGSWTWRVSGAKQPKGVLDGGLLPPGAKVGDILRAEAEFELEGTMITSVSSPPGKRPDPDRLELLSDARPFEGVTTSLVPKGARPRRDREDRGPRGGRDDRGPRGGRDERGPGAARPDRPGARPGDRRGEGRPGAEERGAERAGATPSEGGPRGAPADHGPGGPRGRSGTRPPSRRPEGRGPAGEGTQPEGDRGRQRASSGPPRPKRLTPANTHHNQVLEALAPEERAVAEQLLHGGIPAVRRAVQEQNARAKEEGRPEVKADPLLALAEEILPRLKAAEWRDRAEAAVKDADEIGLRDLRSVVAGADAGARDDESRILAKSLREALDRREAAAREAWVTEITGHLDEGRVARALRVAGRPPDPRTRFPSELIARLTDAASQAMAPETTPDRWAALLSALLESPVRRSVKPVGLPPSPPESLLAAARQASGRVPALAAMLGLHMPPPPGPPRGAPRPGGRPRSPAGGPPSAGERQRPPAGTDEEPGTPPAEASAGPPVAAEADGTGPAEQTGNVGAPEAEEAPHAPPGHSVAPRVAPGPAASAETEGTETAAPESSAPAEPVAPESSAAPDAVAPESPVPPPVLAVAPVHTMSPEAPYPHPAATTGEPPVPHADAGAAGLPTTIRS